MSDPQLICEHCLADNELRLEIASRGNPVPLCTLCGQEKGRALPCDDDRVRRIFRALVRLHFSEPEYNTHLGGDSLQGLVQASHEIFDLGAGASVECFEQAFLTLEDGWYPESSEQISLGGGYWDGGVLWGLREERDVAVTKVLRGSLAQSYFDVEPSARELIKSLRPYITQGISAGAEFVRGRPGVKARMRQQDWLELRQSPSFSYVPFEGTEIGAPPVVLAGANRLNRAHASILYLASDALTAVSELRPHPGELISTGKFRLKQNICIANFADHDVRDFLSDERLEVLRTILSVADVLNVPVQPQNRHLYAATQLLADAIRAEGFDGVSFRSSVGPGMNLVCFNPSTFEFVEGSAEAHEVTALSYDIAKLRTLQQGQYDDQQVKPDSEDPLATLVHGMSRLVRRR